MTRRPIAAALAGVLVGSPALAGVAHDGPTSFGYSDLPASGARACDCAPWQAAPGVRTKLCRDRATLDHAKPTKTRRAIFNTGSN